MKKTGKKSVYTDNEITFAEFGRRMDVSRQCVYEWKKDGRLVLTADGKRVKYLESKDRVKQTANLNGWANEQHAARERQEIDSRIAEKTIEQLTEEVKTTQLDLETKDAKTLFENARALREKEAALLAQIEREKAQASLVSIAVVEKIMFERARSCRDALITSARRMSPLITGKQDIGEVEALLTEEYRNLLEQFARLPLLND